MRMDQLPTPCYVIDEKKLKENLQILKEIREEAGCKILLAQKAFSCFYEYPLIGRYLDGTTASGLYEARLGKEEMGKENHVFAPAYKDADIKELGEICDHIIFNSFAQLRRHKDVVSGKSLGLRINPECSTQGDHAIYDPCAPGSRLGVTKEVFVREIETEPELFDVLDGLHFHTLCEQNADDLATEVMDIVENGLSVLILDASAACHMPDVLEMPYRPPLKDSGNAGEKAFTYRLSSCTCLAGDVIGDYSFDKQIHVGDKLYFQDMAIYSMVKNNTFNGIPLPGIAVMKEDGDCELIRTFGYGDFKGRLA